MFNKITIDLLFNLLLSFVALFFLAFVQMNEKKKEDKNVRNSNQILITMKWEANNDMDLWLMLPNGKHVGYSKRDVPPAHLDVDVVAWRRYNDQNENRDTSHEEHYNDVEEYGEYRQEHVSNENEYVIKHNEEIISIRNTMEGEYVVNVHYFSDRGYGNKPIEVEVLVQDVQNKRIIYADSKFISNPREETHFVKFTVKEDDNGSYTVDEVYTDRPVYFVGKEE